MARIDYVYSAHSAYAYLGAQALYDICARKGAQLVHRPIALSPVVEAAGGQPFAGRSQAHVDYFFGREIERWAEWRGVDILSHRPTYHDAPYDLANALIIAAQRQGQGADALSLALLRAHWRDDADLSHRATLEALVTQVGLESTTLFATAEGGECQADLLANTQEAIAKGILGSPTYLVEGEAFFGQDRLEMVARALDTPFQPGRWSNPPV